MSNTFCRFCYNAGKSESIYLSHYMKTGYGEHMEITCPNLLATKCSNCGEHGHTPKYCNTPYSQIRTSRHESPHSSEGSMSVVTLDDLEAGRYSPSQCTSTICDDAEYASDATLDSMESGHSRTHQANTTYLRALLKIPEPKNPRDLNKENRQPSKLALITPLSFEDQVDELKNVMSIYSRNVIISAMESLNLTPKPPRGEKSEEKIKTPKTSKTPVKHLLNNQEINLHAPLKSAFHKRSWAIDSESDTENEEELF